MLDAAQVACLVNGVCRGQSVPLSVGVTNDCVLEETTINSDDSISSSASAQLQTLIGVTSTARRSDPYHSNNAIS